MECRSAVSFMVVAAALALSHSAAAQQTAEPRQLTTHPAQDGFPSWSPDGQTMVFSRYADEIEPEMTGLWVVSPDGGEPSQLTTYLGEHPDWSPDGRYIAFDGDYGNTIQVVSASGGVPIRVVPESVPVVRGGQPKWSPDGSHIVFKTTGALWLLELATGRIDSLFSAKDKLTIATCWPSRGDEILLYVRDQEGPNAAIWAISANGESSRKITPETDGVYRYADLSPDGSLLAVVWCEERNCDIWAMSPDGGPRVPVIQHPAYDDGPAWSPDGSKIAFVSTRAGNFDIWVTDVDVDRIRKELQRLSR